MEEQEIEQVLGSLGFEYQLIGNKVLIKSDENRIDLLVGLEKALPEANYRRSSSYSSVGHVQSGRFKIVIKPTRAGGSGAGAAMTAIAESAQCLYCAARWYVDGDYSSEGLTKAYKWAQISSSIDDINKLPENWKTSCIKSAEALFGKYGSRKYIFHHGSGLVNQISDVYGAVNKKYRKFTNINKWTPADIWMTEQKYSPNLNIGYDGFKELNAYLLGAARDKNMLGVSLKQTLVPTVKDVNFTADRHTYQYEGYTIGKRGYWNAKDVYLLFNGGEIQFRGFPTWQGEIKGKFANHGKISGGPIREVMSHYQEMSHFETQQRVALKIREKDENFYEAFYDNYHMAISRERNSERPLKFDDFMKQIEKKDSNWQISKYFGTVFLNTAISSGSLDNIVSDLINYAASQSRLSAPYVKVS